MRRPDLPEAAAILRVQVLVDAGFPALFGERLDALLLALVLAGQHQRAEAAARGLAVRRDVHDVLQLQMVEQEAVHRPVVPLREEVAEPVAVEPAYAGLAFVDPIEKAHFAIVGEQVGRFVVQAHVDVVPVLEVQGTHGVDVFEVTDLSLQFRDLLRQIGSGGWRAAGRASFFSSFLVRRGLGRICSSPSQIPLEPAN